jgi:ABC-type amino acid transport substrate-binding protein
MNRALAAIASVLLLTAAPAFAQDLSGTLRTVKETGTLVLGYRQNSAPFSFVEPGRTTPIGYSIDLCLRIADAVQAAVGLPKLEVKWVPVTISDRIDAVATGRVHMECGSTTISLSRQERVDFSHMTWVDGGGLLVLRSAAVGGIMDLRSQKVGVVPGSTTEKALKEALASRAISAEIVPVKDHDEGRVALLDGRIAAYASDRALLAGLILTAPDPKALGITDDQFSYEPYGLMLPRGDAAFRLVVNRTLSTLYRSDAVARLYSKWFAGIGKPGTVLILMYALHALPE